MDLRQIKTFLAVAEELHFGRAAIRLQIAQPAVTAQIQSLEKQLGVPLLTRSTRRVQLTEAGILFNSRCIDILRDIERTCLATQAAAGKDISQITIGTIYPATFGVLPDFIARINQRFPDARIHIHNGNTVGIVREIERGNINLGFIRPVENIGSLRWQSIHRERYLLAISPQNPLSSKSAITPDDLRKQKIIAFSRSYRLQTDENFPEEFKKFDLQKQVIYSCNDTQAMLALITAGVGVGFVPEWVREIPGRNFELRTVEGIERYIGLGLAWSIDDPTVNRDSIIELCRLLIGREG